MKYQILFIISFLLFVTGQSLSQDKAIIFPTTEQEIVQGAHSQKSDFLERNIEK